MHYPCRNKKKIPWAKSCSYFAIQKFPCPGNHNIYFIPCMGLLQIHFFGLVDFNLQGSVIKKGLERPIMLGQFLECFCWIDFHSCHSHDRVPPTVLAVVQIGNLFVLFPFYITTNTGFLLTIDGCTCQQGIHSITQIGPGKR